MELENQKDAEQRNDTQIAHIHAGRIVKLEKQEDADQLSVSATAITHASETMKLENRQVDDQLPRPALARRAYPKRRCNWARQYRIVLFVETDACSPRSF